jgi:putative transposase
MIVAHKIQLDPTVEQAMYFARAAGTARFVWNWALGEWDRQYKAGGKPSGMSLKREFNKVKYELFPWLDGIHRDAHAAPFTNLQKAFVRFFKKTAKRPKRKKKGKSKDSFAIANDKLRVEDTQVRIPVIGWIKMTESIRFDGKIMSATVSRIADRWYISFNIDVGDYTKERTGDGIVGVDLGIKTLAVTSDGEKFQAPKPLKKFKKKLKRAQRRLAKKVKGSNRRNKHKLKIARIHAKIANIRRDCLHKLTTKLCRENQAVVIEDLCVKEMLKNRKLGRAVADLGFYELRRQLTYKSEIYGTLLVIADRWFPSSKTCSNCQTVKDSLSLAERIFKCEICGFEIDRDLNAAENLRTLGLRETYACGPEGSGCP